MTVTVRVTVRASRVRRGRRAQERQGEELLCRPRLCPVLYMAEGRGGLLQLRRRGKCDSASLQWRGVRSAGAMS